MLLFIDSADNYATGDILSKYSNTKTTGGAVDPANTVDASAGRFGTSGHKFRWQNGFGNFPYVKKTLTTSGDTAILGFSYYLSIANTAIYPLCVIWDGATEQVTLTLETDQRLAVRRGGRSGTILGTSAASLTLGLHNYIELKTKISDASGTYEVRVNNASVLSGSSADTKNTANASWTAFSLGDGTNNTFVPGGDTIMYYDDIYCADGSAGQVTDLTGDMRIESLLPSDGNGTNTGLTPSTGTDHGTLVNDATPSMSDYNSSSTPGNKDTYNYPALATPAGAVKGVQWCGYALKTDAGARSVKPVVRHSGADYAGTAIALATAASYLLTLYEQNPGAGPGTWTIADINAAEFGAEVV
jgi:hypothetical protein